MVVEGAAIAVHDQASQVRGVCRAWVFAAAGLRVGGTPHSGYVSQVCAVPLARHGFFPQFYSCKQLSTIPDAVAFFVVIGSLVNQIRRKETAMDTANCLAQVGESCIKNGTPFVFIVPWSSDVLQVPVIQRLVGFKGVHTADLLFSARAGKIFFVIHSNLHIPEVWHVEAVNYHSPDAESFREHLAFLLVAAVRKFSAESLPQSLDEQKSWVYEALRRSTRGLAKPGFAAAATTEVLKLCHSVQPGGEVSRLRSLFSQLDHRGSDVRLETGTVLDAARQIIPYPAPAWSWEVLQSYPWSTTQHINVLELFAFLNFMRAASRDLSYSGLRFFIY